MRYLRMIIAVATGLVVGGHVARAQAADDSVGVRGDSIAPRGESIESVRSLEFRARFSVEEPLPFSHLSSRPVRTPPRQSMVIESVASHRDGSSQNKRRRLWPYFTLGGVGVGALGVTGFVVAPCATGRQKDNCEWLAFALPTAAIGGALIGGAVGTVVGLIVDSGRAGSP